MRRVSQVSISVIIDWPRAVQDSFGSKNGWLCQLRISRSSNFNDNFCLISRLTVYQKLTDPVFTFKVDLISPLPPPRSSFFINFSNEYDTTVFHSFFSFFLITRHSMTIISTLSRGGVLHENTPLWMRNGPISTNNDTWPSKPARSPRRTIELQKRK